jgi:hypothetical protein
VVEYPRRVYGMTHGVRIAVLLAVTAVAGAAMRIAPRVPQDPGYHRFADTRTLWGQFLPALLILLVLWRCPPRYPGGGFLLGVLAVYGAAKVFEALDGLIFFLGHLPLAAWWVLKALDTRRMLAAEGHT